MGTGKRKIEIKMREKEAQRMVTFSKRRKGLFKKAHDLYCLTGTHIALVAFSPAGRPYTHGDPSFDATVDRYIKGSDHDQEYLDGGRGDGGAKMMELKIWLDGIRVEDCHSMEELVLMREKMEEIRGKLLNRIEYEFASSFFFCSSS